MQQMQEVRSPLWERRTHAFVTCFFYAACFAFLTSAFISFFVTDYPLFSFPWFLSGIVVFAFLGGTAFSVYFGTRLPAWKASLLIFVLAFSLRLMVLFANNVSPMSDFLYYFDTAISVAQGNTQALAGHYFSVRFPFLQAFIVYESFLIRLFGATQVPLQIINCFFSSGIAVIIGLIGSRMGRQVGLLAGLLYALYPGNIVFSSVLSGQHIGVFLYCLFFLLYVQRPNTVQKKCLLSLLCGMILGLAQLFRAISFPILVGIAFYTLYQVLRENKRKPFLAKITPFLAAALLFAGYTAVTSGFDLYAYHKGYRAEPSVQSDMKTKFLIGLYPGFIPEEAEQFRDDISMMSEEEKTQQLLSYLQYYLGHPFSFVIRQASYVAEQWGSPDSGFFWRYTNEMDQLAALRDEGSIGESERAQLLRYQNMERVYIVAEGTFHFLIMLFCFRYFWSMRKMMYDDETLFFLITLLLYIGVHCIIEYQSRYRYFGMPFFILYAAKGMINSHFHLSAANLPEGRVFGG